MLPIDKTGPVAPTRMDIYKAIQAIDPTLPSAYWAHKKGEDLCVWNDTVPTAKVENIRFCLGKIRHRNIPGTIVDGNRENISADNVFEPVHMVMFNNSIVGIEKNQYGPYGAMALPMYFSHMNSGLEPFSLKPLWDKDILATLNRFRELSFIRLVIEREKIGLLNNADETLSQSLGNISNKYPAAVLELVIKIQQPEAINAKGKDAAKKRDQRNTIASQFSTATFNEAMALVSDASALKAFEKLEVHGIDNRTGKANTIDLLSRLIFAKKDVRLVNTTHGMVERESMYSAIIEAEQELRPTLKTAIAAG